MKTIGMVSLGCPKNLVDAEIMLGLLEGSGYRIVPDEKEASIIIVNTCGFIESARQESIDAILEMAKHKMNNCELLIVTGCLAERYKDEIQSEIPEVDAVLGTGSYMEIAAVIKEAYVSGKTSRYNTPDDVSYLENDRVLSTGRGYAYLKIAEGCDNCCTYCVIPSLRGAYRSRPMEAIVSEAERLAEKGVKELILVAQDTTRYGDDVYYLRKLPELLRELSRIDGIEWVRLLYCYPEEITEELLMEIAENKKILRYFDIPVQHASDRILSAMGRRGDSVQISEKLDRIREIIPDAVLRTSIIVGFPGETEKDFEILKNFIILQRFDRLGVFMYSKEENTKAAAMKPQIGKLVKKNRYNEIMKLQQSITFEKNIDRIGKIYKVICEGVADDGVFYYGRSCMEAPDIDGVIYFTSPEPLNAGVFVNVKIHATENYDLIGEACL